MKTGRLNLGQFGGWKNFCAVLLFLAAAAVSQAQVFETLVTFTGRNGQQATVPVQGLDGELYATGQFGGTNGWGTAFKTTLTGDLTTLDNFCEQCAVGGEPEYGGLMLAFDGSFYGATMTGGTGNDGTIFRLRAEGTLTTLYNFGASGGPILMNPRLVQVSNGNFYAASPYGGQSCLSTDSTCGTVFKMTPSATVTTVYNFCSQINGLNCLDGQHPSSLLLGRNGRLYGTTSGGGTFQGGTVFEISRAGALKTLYNFCSQTNCADGANPDSIIQGADGNFYGATSLGGNDNNGTLFKLTPDGALTTLYTFCSRTQCNDGATPGPLMQASDGNLYGFTVSGGDPKCMAGGCGTIFELSRAGKFFVLHTFSHTDGALPNGLMQDTNGNFYGTTDEGGDRTCDCGTLFSLSTGLSPFVAFVRPFGSIGQSGGILGQGFTGTTGVFLNGSPVAFTVISDTYIQATVPAGATTGFVTVMTPTGALTSNVVFRVGS